MKTLNYFMFLLFIIASTTVVAQNKDAVLGKWLSEGGDGQILIYKNGDVYNGKLAWMKKPNNDDGTPNIDDKNPNPSLQNRPLLGLQLLKGFHYAGNGVWDKGTIYDPKSGKTYRCKMNITSSDKLEIRGYVGISLLGRTINWTRVR